MEEIDLGELLKIFWNKKLQIIFITIIVTLGALFCKIAFVTPVYSASTTLVLAASNTVNNNGNATIMEDGTITTTDLTINSKLISTYSELVKSKKVIRTVKDNLKINLNEDKLRKNIKVSCVKDTELIQITVTDEDKEMATKIANEIAAVFMDMVKGIYNIENVQVVDKAEVPVEPSNTNYKKDAVIFALIGFGVSIMYVFISNLLDNTIKTEDEIESLYQLSVLACIPVCEENGTKEKKGGRK